MGEITHGDFAISGFARGDGEAAISNDGGGNAQGRGGIDKRVPGNLGVVVCVAVNDAWHESQTFCIYGLFGLKLQGRADFVDKPIVNGDI